MPGEDRAHRAPVSSLFFAQESSESTNTTIEDEDTKGTGRGTREAGRGTPGSLALCRREPQGHPEVAFSSPSE